MTKVCDHCGSALPEFGGILCDDDRHTVRFQGKFIRNFTPKEHALFRILLDAQGRVLSKEKLISDLYVRRVIADAEIPEDKIIDVYVCKINKKLKTIGLCIRNSWGRGYFLEEPNV